jgi:hypothetical protein
MFDSPMEHCPVCGHYVVLDQTQAECARRQDCASDTVCPLLNLFTEINLGRAAPKILQAGRSPADS